LSELTESRQLNRGYHDGFTRAFEIVLTPLLFGYFGSLVDGWLGTRPGFTVGLAAFAVTGVFVKLWVTYDQAMRQHEAALLTARARPAAPRSQLVSGKPIRTDEGIR
jgi:hypothetical protein